MSELTCKDCAHYRQHYGISDGKIFRVFCGHCTLHIRRQRRPDAQACGQFSPGAENQDTFANKEYLSKKLLDYVLSLELFPGIGDLPSGSE